MNQDKIKKVTSIADLAMDPSGVFILFFYMMFHDQIGVELSAHTILYLAIAAGIARVVYETIKRLFMIKSSHDD